jgi:sugar transferase (PEP-CTERM system associated)
VIRLFHVYFPARTIVLAVSETVLVVVALLLAMILRFRGDVDLALRDDQALLKIAVASIVLMVCMHYYDLYDSLVLHRPVEVITRLVQVLGTASVILAGVYYAAPEVQLGRGPFIIWIVLAGIFLAIWRYAFRAINRRVSEGTVLLGGGAMAETLSAEIKSRPELGLSIVGVLDSSVDAGSSVSGVTYLGNTEDLPAVLDRQNVRRIIVTMGDRRRRMPVEMLLSLKNQGVQVENAPDIYEAVTGKICLESLRPTWLLFSSGFRLSRMMLLYKRTASIMLSLLGIVVTAPLMSIAALAVWLDTGGPVLFRQVRIGRGGRPFTIFKFRSMRKDADPDGLPRAATAGDDRVTRVGRWLRKLHIDELPQLLNILLGDMYFIGPRPFVPSMEAELEKQIPFYSQRWIVKPGATGWAQVRRGYCATLEDNIEKLGYDLFYIKNISIGLDFVVLFETIKILILGRGGR